ncbi:MAG: leucine-rich repeat protein [Paludibacteraceae bacterium]|nr:leucine-rich repeat protein [Paludibacteraceae bacterium]
MRKILSFALALVAGVMSMNAQTALDTTQVDGIWYILDKTNHTATVTYTPGETGGIGVGTYSGHLNIPETIWAQSGNDYADYTVTAIGDNAFAWCSGLTQITIPATVKTLGVNLLTRTSGVTSLKIADGADPIYFSYAQSEAGEQISFAELAWSCTDLYLGRNVEVQSSLEYTSPVFHTWNEVLHLTFGEQVTKIPDGFCPWCRNIQTIQTNTPKPLAAGQGMLMFLEQDQDADPKAITLYVPEGQKRQYEQMDFWKNLTIEEMGIEQQYGIKWVDGMFDFQVGGLYYKKGAVAADGSEAVSVVIPQVWYLNPDGSYVSTWSSEFPYKQSRIEIPSQITVYDSDYGETKTYPVVEIGDYAFRGATNLEELIIPTSVTAVGTEIVEYADKLKHLDIPESVTKVGWLAFARCGIEEITLPVSQSQWGSDAAFQECTNLTKAVFAQGNTFVQDRIFFGCEALRVVEMPDGIIEIGAGAFAGCNALHELRLPEGLIVIRNRTFRGCPLRSLEIPSTVEEIEGSALLGTMLSKLTVNANNKVFDSRDNCNAVIRTKDNTLIAATNGAFIPESVDSIAMEAFVELPGIRSLTLPKGLKRIDTNGLMNLENLTLITSYIENPAGVLENGAMENWYADPFGAITLYVPAGTKAAYQADEQWAKFSNIIEMEGENKPASVSELTPVTNESDVTFTSVDETTDLTNTVVDNIYVTCDTIGGDTYDKQEGAFVFQTVVDELMISNILQNENNMDILRNNFAGIVLQVPAGEGTLTLTVKTTGERQVAITIKGMETALFEQLAKGEVTFDYSVTRDAYVYIYPVLAEAQAPASVLAKLRRHAPEAAVEDETESNVAIYGVRSEVRSTINAVEDIEDNEHVQVRKVLEQGQVIIIRDGKRYNVLGTEVK